MKEFKLWFLFWFHLSKSYGSYGSGSTTLIIGQCGTGFTTLPYNGNENSGFEFLMGRIGMAKNWRIQSSFENLSC